ncbi:hypothetical protein L2E82_19729 [Cichorium intybus]|uniref:Uncharacterized protein n=1 Tax=Cichorium intybus TaxID=13427 RepID=A0ACB9FCW0_CICIN|nr:hypothetical protein L2E82_19729 [Cichorium intybus]
MILSDESLLDIKYLGGLNVALKFNCWKYGFKWLNCGEGSMAPMEGCGLPKPFHSRKRDNEEEAESMLKKET